MAQPQVSAARDEILARVRDALRDVPSTERPEEVSVPRAYRRSLCDPRALIIERFCERLLDYGADVRRISSDTIGSTVTEACARLQLKRLVVPVDLPEGWRPHGVEVIEDERLSAQQLDQFDAALTGGASAIAETGTIVLDGQGASGRRAITLVPDHHICVIRASQVLASVPEAVAQLAHAVTEDRIPVTFVSGPSASSDIELSRVEGVHGPRHLLALIVADAPRGA